MRIICWNLEKRSELTHWAFDHKHPNIALFQEWVGKTENGAQDDGVFRIEMGKQGIELDLGIAASFCKGSGVAGTCIMTTGIHIKKFTSVRAPKADYRLQFWKGMAHKATAIALLVSGLTVVSFHGYNGTFQGRKVEDLMGHIDVVMGSLQNTDGPVVWAGDFNTFTAEHLQAVDDYMTAAGFCCDLRVPYDSKKTLDLVFTRLCRAELVETGKHYSDHPYIVFEIVGI